MLIWFVWWQRPNFVEKWCEPNLLAKRECVIPSKATKIDIFILTARESIVNMKISSNCQFILIEMECLRAFEVAHNHRHDTHHSASYVCVIFICPFVEPSIILPKGKLLKCEWTDNIKRKSSEISPNICWIFAKLSHMLLCSLFLVPKLEYETKSKPMISTYNNSENKCWCFIVCDIVEWRRSFKKYAKWKAFLSTTTEKKIYQWITWWKKTLSIFLLLPFPFDTTVTTVHRL